MNGLFIDIRFISKYIVLMAALRVSVKQTNPRKLRAETQINMDADPIIEALVGKGPPCHKSSSNWVRNIIGR